LTRTRRIETPACVVIRIGGPAARREAAISMRSRKAGLISAQRQRVLGYPNLEKAWIGLRKYWRRWHLMREGEEAGRALEQRRRDLARFYESQPHVVKK
jgi:hypothetical protein